eukprot:scaffold191606_cov21-Tisochrysis_lutea.AAC.1
MSLDIPSSLRSPNIGSAGFEAFMARQFARGRASLDQHQPRTSQGQQQPGQPGQMLPPQQQQQQQR